MEENIYCSFMICNLEKPPAYHASSYVWGEESPIHHCRINGRTKWIRPGLFNALRRLRLAQGQLYIWIDDLCINQTDTLERNAQVKQMAMIYYQASGVFVWLGEESSTSSSAMDLIQKMMSAPSYEWESRWWKDPKFAALLDLLSRVWFQRGWIVQEAAFAQITTICCGGRQSHLRVLIEAVRLIRSQILQHQSTPQTSFGDSRQRLYPQI
jgi:hypothetical protein